MTPAELRDKIAAEICVEFYGTEWKDTSEFRRNICLRLADAALRVVRKAMREPSDDMLTAIESVQVAGDFAIEVESRAIYRALIAASPLREE
jgi:hypothetical protein